MKKKVVVSIRREDPFVTTRIAEIEIPEHKVVSTGLTVRDLKIYDDECEVVIHTQEVQEKPKSKK